MKSSLPQKYLAACAFDGREVRNKAHEFKERRLSARNGEPKPVGANMRDSFFSGASYLHNERKPIDAAVARVLEAAERVRNQYVTVKNTKNNSWPAFDLDDYQKELAEALRALEEVLGE